MGARILVADDSATIQKVVELTLSRENVELIQARSGDEAMQKARAVKPDLMLIDHSMPGHSGQELCGAIRQDSQLTHVPIILMAGVAGNVDEAAARQAGATDVVSKPFESQVLIGKVKQLLLEAPAAVAGEAAVLPVQEEVAVETGEQAFVLESKETMAEEIKIPAGVTGEEVPLEIVTGEPSEEAIPTYDLSTAEGVDLPIEQVVHEDAQPSPAPEHELAIEDMAAAVGFGSSATQTVEEKPAEPLPSAPPVQEAPAAPVGPVTVPPDMVETLARQVSERVATQIVQELRADLLQRIERLLWEVVPDLAEQLLTQEIQRIRDLVEGRK
ncbi:MAG: response regulator [Candidatus Methylomirabilales bacterium]